MTALSRYQRLEATGRYREAPGETPSEAVISFGERSLTIMDAEGTPFAHWPLATLTAVDAPGAPLTLAPDPTAPERLTVADPEMAAAIRAVAPMFDAEARRRRRRLRRMVVGGAAAALVLVAAVYAPQAVERLVAGAPVAARAALGDAAVDRFSKGRICDRPPARRALDRLGARLGLPPGARVAVDAPAPEGVAALATAGERVVLFREALRTAPDAGTLALAVAAALAGAERRPPVVMALSEAGFVGLVDMIAGDTASSALVAAAADLLREGRPPPDAAGAAARLAALGLTSTDAPLLGAEAWTALQRACEP